MAFNAIRIVEILRTISVIVASAVHFQYLVKARQGNAHRPRIAGFREFQL